MSELKAVAEMPDDLAATAIERLEQALAFARENPVRSVSIFSISRDGTICHGYVASSCAELVGMLEFAKSDVIADSED